MEAKNRDVRSKVSRVFVRGSHRKVLGRDSDGKTEDRLRRR
jgi:hypothetical protein